MKRVITLLMAVVMVFGAASLASAAVQFSASGHMHMNFSVLDNTGYDKDAAEDNFFAGQRFRPKLTMKAEGVTAVFEAQTHQRYWGETFDDGNSLTNDIGYYPGNPSVDFRIRQAYIDFKLPSTPVSLKVGYQDLALPSIWGHPVFRTRVGAAVATIPFNDNASLVPFWARPAHNQAEASKSDNSTDMFGALLPLSFGKVSATPYFVYARVGDGNENDTLMVGGANLNIMATDALSIKADLIVTDLSSDNNPDIDSTGWMFATDIGYKMAWGTPGVFGWYATGSDKNGEDYLYTTWTDGFGPTSFGFSGSNTYGYHNNISGGQAAVAGGTWALGLKLADMSFVDSLKHTARLVYGQGTSDKGAASGWTEEDSFIEANFDSTWSIYENLSAMVELGAILPDWGSKGPNNGREDDMALKAQLTLRFVF